MRRKVIIITTLFIIEIVFCVYASALIIQTMKGVAVENLNLSFIDSFRSIFIDQDQKMVFLISQAVLLMVALFMGSGQSNVKQMTITNKIKTPIAAGQGQYGTARFLKESEKKEIFNSAKIEKGVIKFKNNTGSLLIEYKGNCKKGEILHIDMEGHCLIQGPTGMGKTRRVLLQTIVMQILSGVNIVATDIKQEIYAYTKDLAIKEGYETICVNFYQLLRSMHYNFLQPILKAIDKNRYDEAIEKTWDLVSVLVGERKGEPIWHNGECATIASGILAVSMGAPKENRNLTNVYYFLANMCKENPLTGTTYLSEYLEEFEDSYPAKSVFAMGDIAPDRTRGGFFSSALGTLKEFASPRMSEMSAKSDFDLEDICTKKTILYIVIPEDRKTLYPLVSILFTQIYNTQIDYSKNHGSTLKIKTDYVIEEFGSLPYIPIISSLLSAGRSHGLRFIGVLQDDEQGEKAYPKEYKNIKNNCKHILFLGGKDNRTLKAISDDLGTYTVQTPGTSVNTSGNKENRSASRNLGRRELLKPEEVGRLQSPYALVTTRGEYPAITKLPDISKTPFNEILGLGDKIHNQKLIEKAMNELPERKCSNEIPLWGIWNKYIININMINNKKSGSRSNGKFI